MAVNSSQENSSLNRGSSLSTILNSDEHGQPEVSHHVQLNSTQEKALFNIASVRGRSLSPKCPNDQQKPEASLHVQPNSSYENSLFSRGRSQSLESRRNITSSSPALDIDVEHNSPIYGPTECFAPLATSSSLDEQVVIKAQFCIDTVKLATCRTETSSVMPLLCPFECGVVFKTQTDQRQHLMKEHSCTHKEKDFFLMKEKLKKKITPGIGYPFHNTAAHM